MVASSGSILRSSRKRWRAFGFGSGLSRSSRGKEVFPRNEEKCYPKPKCVNHVLTWKCYPCSDRAQGHHKSQLPTANCQQPTANR